MVGFKFKLLGNQVLLGALYSRMGPCDCEFGHFDHGIERLTKAVELCEAAGNVEDTGYAYAWLGWNHLFAGHYDRVLAVKEELLRTMQQQFNPR